jgi:putative solute:sodium symporter small subunit
MRASARCSPADGGQAMRAERRVAMSHTDGPAANDAAWWQKTWNLMIVALTIWAFFAFVIHIFVSQLNQIVIFGFPLGFYMAAQGSLIAFVVLLFWFAHRQDSIDREFGIAEDE